MLCEKNSLPLRISRPVVKDGWLGKPKGLLQVLWERGLIDATKRSAYTLDGRKNRDTGEVNSSMSLRRIMSECHDFVNEELTTHPSFMQNLRVRESSIRGHARKPCFADYLWQQGRAATTSNCKYETAPIPQQHWIGSVYAGSLREQEHTYAPIIGWQRSSKSSSNKRWSTRRRKWIDWQHRDHKD